MGGQSLFTRLIELVKAGVARSGTSGGDNTQLLDENLQPLDRIGLDKKDTLLQSQCLFYAATAAVAPLPQNELTELLALAGGAAPQADHDQAGVTVLFAAVAALRTCGNVGDVGPVRAAIAALRSTAAGVAGVARDQADVLRLAAGVALVRCGLKDEGSQLLERAARSGAFASLLDVLRSAPFRDDELHRRNICVDEAHLLMFSLLDCDKGRELMQTLRDGAEPAFGDVLRLLAEVYELGPPGALSRDEEVLHEFLPFVIEADSAQQLLVPLLGLLRALARSEDDARYVWRFLQSTYNRECAGFTWAAFVHAAVEYCKRFRDAASNGAASAAYGEASAAPFARDEAWLAGAGGSVSVSDEDVDGIVAYLGLLSRILVVAPPAEAAAWVRELETNAGGDSLLALLFRLLAASVPSRLKAALFSAVGAFAGDAESAAVVWDLLAQAQVVRDPLPLGGGPSVGGGVADALGGGPRPDLGYQLAEVEGRLQTYGETTAFVELVNSLLELTSATGSGPAAQGGAPVASIFRFVRDSVFAQLHRRQYRDAQDRWRLAAACLHHFALLASLWRPQDVDIAAAPAARGLRGGTPGGSLPCDEVLADMLSDGPLLRGALDLVRGGAEKLTMEREAPHGSALEVAVHRVLLLLLAALSLDGAALRRAFPALPHLEAVLLRDPRRGLALLSFLGYPFSYSIKLAAVQLLRPLASGSGRLAALLVEAGVLAQLQDDAAALLQDGFYAAARLQDDEESGEREMVEAAQELVAFLRTTLHAPPPSCAQLLLLGAASGSGALAAADQPRGGVLQVLVELVACQLEVDALPSAHRMQEHLLGLLCVLGGDPALAPLLCQLLAAPDFDPVRRLKLAAQQPLPAAAAARAAALGCRAHLLTLVTQLLYAGAGRGAPSERTARELLMGLFERPPDVAQPCSLELLRLALAPPPPPDRLEASGSRAGGAFALAELQQRQEELRVKQLLAAPGMRTVTERGDEAVLIPALHEALLAEARRLAAGSGGLPGRAADLKEAIRMTLHEMGDQNAAIAETSARGALLGAWAQLVGLCAAHHHGTLVEALGEAGAAAALQEATLEALQGVCVLGDRQLSSGPALQLCSAAHVLANRTRASGAAAPALVPAQCHATLRALVRALQRGDRSDSRRALLHAALLAYLQACASAGAPRGSGLGAANVTLLLREGGQCLSELARDAAEGAELLRALALALLEALADSAGDEAAGALGSVLLGSGLLPTLASGLPLCLEAASVSAPATAARLLATAEAQMSLLLRCAIAFPGGASAVEAANVVSALAACRGLSLLSSQEAGSGPASAPGDGLLVAALRICVCLLRALPASPDLAAAAAAFCEAHCGPLLRVLADRTPAAGLLQAQELVLAVDLVCACFGRGHLPQPVAQYRAALDGLLWDYLTPERAGANKYLTAAIALRDSSATSPAAVASAAALERAVRQLRARLLMHLLAEAARGAPPLPLAPLDGAVLRAAGPPTLLAVAQMLSHSSRDLQRALLAEQSASQGGGDQDAASEVNDAGLALQICELTLQLVYVQLCLLSQQGAATTVGQLGGVGATLQGRVKFDISRLEREVRSAADSMLSLQLRGISDDRSFLRVLARRCGELFFSLEQ